MLVRFARRKTAWETRDASQIREVEFKNAEGDYDLKPSTYEVDATQLSQTLAEHAAAAPIDPPSSTLALDVAGTRFPVASCPGNDTFMFTRESHREVMMSTRAELDEFIAWLVASLDSRRHPIPKADVFSHVASRLLLADREWLDLAKSTKAKPWLIKLAQKRP